MEEGKGREGRDEKRSRWGVNPLVPVNLPNVLYVLSTCLVCVASCVDFNSSRIIPLGKK